MQILNNEFHDNCYSIDVEITNPVTISSNLSYHNILQLEGTSKGFMVGWYDATINIDNNVSIMGGWGFAHEGPDYHNLQNHDNISAFSSVGVMLYQPPEQSLSHPQIYDNIFWKNKIYWVSNPQENPSNIVRGSQYDLIRGHWITHEFDSENHTVDPNFVNVKIYDLRADTDNDGLLDGVETGTGIYNGPNDTGSDPNNWDTDEDGVDDGTEVRLGFNPVDPEDTPVLYEADVASRPDGDGQLLVNDWVQVGRFVAGLDSPAVGSEYQRVDCAPLDTSGDGQVLVNDWVQAGRYVAGLDAAQPQAGPIAPNAGR